VLLELWRGIEPSARKALPELLALAGKGQVSPYNLAMIYGALGEKDQAFAWLKKVDDNPRTSALFRFDSDLDSLRSDSRFTALTTPDKGRTEP
jgi:hypothetical protein